MDPNLRRIFNENFSDGLYTSYLRDIEGRLGAEFQFRLAETPVFLPGDLRARLVSAAEGIMAQLVEPRRMASMREAVPAMWDSPGMTALPSFTQIDLAVVRGAGGELEPRLIELQGFPSLTAMQVIQRDAWSEALQRIDGLQGNWSCWFSGLGRESFLDLARRTIAGDHDPETVVLLDLDPPTQKTLPDFNATRLLFGVEAVCITQVFRQGRRLFRRSGGRVIPIRRIYNRVVFDELVQKGVRPPFDYREGLDVEWAPHPNWYWVWSKNSIPFLDHPAVPRARLLSQLEEIPEDLPDRFVLKPLFSFAGGGVRVAPRSEDIDRIPAGERNNWCLQEKVAYEPALRAADGSGVKVEVRMMFLKPDDAPAPVLGQNLCRLSRGEMLGVDFNKDFTWVGSSVALWR